MRHLAETPWWICDQGDINYCAYSDTDSVYISAEPILLHLYPEFEEFEDKKKDDILEVIALNYQDIITNEYDNLVENVFNVKNQAIFTPDEEGGRNHRLEMKTECVIRAAYFRATRRYAQWITKTEGVDKESLDIKGLEFQKSNFPPVLGKFFNKVVQQTLKGETEEEIIRQVKVIKNEVLEGIIPLKDLGNPTSVKKLNKYASISPRAGEVFSSILKGAPAPVKAAVRYNDLLRLWGLTKKHGLITQSDKIKWIYLKDNAYKMESLAYLEHDIPDKIQEFLDIYADREKVFESILLNKLEGFFTDMEWSLKLNPHLDKFSFKTI